MNLRDLQYLVALAEQRHFGKAADACFVSQPTLSMQIRKLEEEVGVPLVLRTTRRVQLTPAGQEFLLGARETLALAGQTVERAQRAARGEVGRLAVGLGSPGCSSSQRRSDMDWPAASFCSPCWPVLEVDADMEKGGIKTERRPA